MPTKNAFNPSTVSTGSQQLFQQLGLPVLTFGALLEAYRTEHNLTQEAIAQQLGTVKQRICDYEAGRRLPTLKLAHQIALTLGGVAEVWVQAVVNEQLKKAGIPLQWV